MKKTKQELIEIEAELTKTNEDSKQLSQEQLEKLTKLEIRRILKNNKTNGKIDWFSAISEFREKYNLPKWISIEEFASFATHIELTGKEKANFDEYLKFLKEVDLNIIKNENIDKIDINKTVNNQLQDSKQGLVELVSNGADSYGLSIGRFGKGFFGALAFLNDEKSELKLQTKMKEGKAFEITFKKINGKYSFHSKPCDKKESGTKVKLNKPFSLEEIHDFKGYLIEKYGTNKFVKINLNGEQINNLDGYIDENGKALEEPKDEVNITINENGFEVVDNGIGMSAEIISTKLLRPKDTTKERIIYTEEQLRNEVPKEISFFYKTGNMEQVKNNENSRKNTKIKLQMSGVEIESFDIPTTHNIETFVLELPKGTWVPDSRNQISPTREVVVAIKTMIHKINDFESVEEKMKLLEIAEIIINELSKRPVNEIKKEYQIDFVAKESFEEIKKTIESQNLTCIPNFDGIKDILGEKSGVVYIPPSFMELDVSKVPEVQKIANVENAKIPFFLADFSENTDKIVIVHKSGVLINKKYAVSPELITTINNLINLNVGYEQDMVFYGRIDGGKIEFEKIETENKIHNDSNNHNHNILPYYLLIEKIRLKSFVIEKLNVSFSLLIKEINNLKNDLLINYFNLLVKEKKFMELDLISEEKIKYFFISDEKDISNLPDDNFINKYLNFIEKYDPKVALILIKLDKKLGGNENRQKILNKFFEIAEKSFGKQSVVDLFIDLTNSDLPIFDIINIDWENLENLNLEELYKKDIRLFIGVLEARIGKKIESIVNVIEIDGGMAMNFKIEESGKQFYVEIVDGDVRNIKIYGKVKSTLKYLLNNLNKNHAIINGKDYIFDNGFGPDEFKSLPNHITGLAKLLQNDGELLDIENGLNVDLFGLGSIKLSEIIALNKLQNTSINGISQNYGLENGKNELLRKYPGLGNSEEINQFKRLIEGTIISQDKASNMWTKELPANSLDVSSKVDINFFQNKNGNFVSHVKDDCGMSPEQVFQYLLNPDKSSKQPGEGVGMFGQGFFTAFVGIEELNIKTGNGEKTTYLKIKPLEINGKIVDFEVTYNITDGNFKGTIIERVDNNTGFDGNLEALLCLQTIQTNLGNVEKGEINYNGERVNKPENKSLVSNIEVPNIGNLRLFKTRNNKEKITLKGYYLSEIKGEYLDMLPDWIIEYIKKQNLSLDLPIGLEPTQSRNSITNFDENIKTLKPYLFRLFIDYILREYLAGRLTIPMMSLDFWRDRGSIDYLSQKIALNYNYIHNISNDEIEYLKDKKKMVEFLVMVDFEINGEKTSLMKMKIEQDTKLAQGKTKKSIINDFLAKANFKKGEVVSKKVLEKNIGKEKYNKFFKYINDKFGKLFDEVIGYRPTFEVVEGEGEGFLASAGGGTINIEIKALKNWIENYEKDEKTREYIEKIITHELTHLEEQAE